MSKSRQSTVSIVLKRLRYQTERAVVRLATLRDNVKYRHLSLKNGIVVTKFSHRRHAAYSCMLLLQDEERMQRNAKKFTEALLSD